jgi:hypothetical protein
LAHAADSKSSLAVLFMAEEIGQHAKALAQEKGEAKLLLTWTSIKELCRSPQNKSERSRPRKFLAV